MPKRRKIIFIITVCITLLTLIGTVTGKIGLDYLFNKVSHKIIKDISDNKNNVEITDENKAADGNKAADENKQVIDKTGKVYEIADETVPEENRTTVKDSKGKEYTVKKNDEPQKGSSVNKAVVTLEELTPKQISEIQNMVTTTDKIAVMNICIRSLAGEDKKEIKAMINNGGIDYGRLRTILSNRLSAADKKKIYSYYEKYIQMYFEGKQQ
ncbi:MAG: hypothetical protein Q8873_07725 [Bacillota bacterium]|nr:hypothetical protein [Bacillota bacterium]